MGASLEREVELLKPQRTHCSPSEVIACNRVDRTHPGHDDIMTPQGRQDAPPRKRPVTFNSQRQPQPRLSSLHGLQPPHVIKGRKLPPPGTHLGMIQIARKNGLGITRLGEHDSVVIENT